MARTSAAENEASILAFRRERLGDGCQVAHVSLRSGETSLLHSHTRTRDTFYVVAGCLTLTLYEDPEVRTPSSWVSHARRAEVRQDETSVTTTLTRAGTTRVRRVSLRPGDVFVIEPGVVHCAANLHEEPCSFLCIEGIGEYDFVLGEGL